MIRKALCFLLICSWVTTAESAGTKTLKMTFSATCFEDHAATNLVYPRYDDRHPLRYPALTFILPSPFTYVGAYTIDRRTIKRATYCVDRDNCEVADSAVVNVKSIHNKMMAGDFSVSFPSGTRRTGKFVAVTYVLEDIPCI